MNELYDTSLFSDASLKAYYRLENTNDSKASYNLTNNNTVTFSAAKFNNGANLGASNTNKSLTVASNLGVTTGAISIAMWVKPLAEITTGTWALVHHSASTGAGADDLDNRIDYDYNSGTRRLSFRRYTNSLVGAFYTINLSTSLFYHLVYTFDGATIRGYVNGYEVTSESSTSTTYNNTTGNGFRLGRYDISSNHSSVLIDDVAVFGKALSLGEVRLLYTKTGSLFYQQI